MSIASGREMDKMDLNELSSKIIKAAINVHKELGPGLLESVYQKCLLIELKLMGLKAESEILLPVTYRGQKVDDDGFRIDARVYDKLEEIMHRVIITNFGRIVRISNDDLEPLLKRLLGMIDN